MISFLLWFFICLAKMMSQFFCDILQVGSLGHQGPLMATWDHPGTTQDLLGPPWTTRDHQRQQEKNRTLFNNKKLAANQCCMESVIWIPVLKFSLATPRLAGPLWPESHVITFLSIQFWQFWLQFNVENKRSSFVQNKNCILLKHNDLVDEKQQHPTQEES